MPFTPTGRVMPLRNLFFFDSNLLLGRLLLPCQLGDGKRSAIDKKGSYQ